ncbi:nucleoside/nucleotide kinase family protein [Donghicola sp. C2-DW-16]|uniref:Nucleoside/nucleotide kinase family protein n=1 Tax=Donghicola mangrovi TaxID=2729614 RepID=A0ABX2PEW6_9RHOB|nr:nucleoside/nucleotide kinase family protein [Donghicola mangrovi]NVO28048.1 nucleoside/nucleotide kinase family protein [Donghicola mangrovi]
MVAQSVGFDELVQAAGALMFGAGRKFIGIAGAPGSGKSTTVERLLEALEEDHPGQVAILPMDGFHYDDAVLHQMGRRPWKGAPDTFDVGGLVSVLRRLKDGSETRVAVPVFDRDLEISRGSARIIPDDVKLILVEGNYVLLDRTPWDALAGMFDLTVMIDVPEEELRRRLRARWEHFGLTEDQIAHKLDGNDLPNGRDVIQGSRPADIIYRQDEGSL